MSVPRTAAARAWLLAAGWVLLAGCGRQEAPPSLLDDETAAGVPVRELLSGARPNVILAYPAGYCFACAQQISEWQRLHRNGHANLIVLLAREPSAAERNALAVRRIPVAGVLRRARSEPEEYLVDGGRVRLLARGTGETGSGSRVLAAVRERARAGQAAPAPPPAPAVSAQRRQVGNGRAPTSR
jgi:hypothetical protein